MAGENWARQIVEREMNRTTVINDDGTAPRMYDLRVGPKHAPELAVECFQAVDSMYTETWCVGAAKGPLQLSLNSNWIVETSPNARIKTFKQHIEPILQELENRGIYNLLVDHHLKWQDATLFGRLALLDVTHAVCYEVPGSGKVQLALPGVGGAVDERGEAVPDWISNLLRQSKYEDVLRKLENSGAIEKHAFVFVGFAGAPWVVEGYLAREINQTPTQPPDLPFPVTGVWVIAQTGQRGLRWDGNAWLLFDA